MNDFEVGIFDVVGKFNYFSEVPLALEYQPKSHLSFIFCTRREKAVRYCGGLRTKNASTQSESLEAYEKVNCFLLYLLFFFFSKWVQKYRADAPIKQFRFSHTSRTVIDLTS